MGRITVCPPDCLRRKVGCRSDCPEWAEHERRKAERYAEKAREAAATPTPELKEKNYRRKLNRSLSR